MFSIRVDWHSPEFPNYSAYCCDTYTVAHLATGAVQVSLFSQERNIANLLIDDPTPLSMTGSVAYVMNERGQTIDTIRPIEQRMRDRRANTGRFIPDPQDASPNQSTIPDPLPHAR